MVRQKQLRRKPSAPDLAMARGPTSPTSPPSSTYNTKPLTAIADPASPPDTPDASPYNTRKSSRKPRYQPPPFHAIENWLDAESSITPVGHNHQFSYRPKHGNPSPRSTCSASAREDSASVSSSIGAEANADSSPDQSDSELLLNPQPESDTESDTTSNHTMDRDAWPSASNRYASLVETEMVVEEIDPMDSDYEGVEALFPDAVDSDRSPSGSPDPVLRGTMQQPYGPNRNSNAINDDAWSTTSGSSSSLSQDSAERAFYKQQAELKRRRRVSMSSSLGKRTYSELSGDSDGESATEDVNQLGSSARRFRKRLHRTSLLFQDPPVQRIEELEEPDSSEDERELLAGLSLARQLPYWDIEVVEIASP